MFYMNVMDEFNEILMFYNHNYNNNVINNELVFQLCVNQERRILKTKQNKTSIYQIST